MQIQVFRIGVGDPAGLEELNRFLRGHRILSVDRHFEAGVWHFCVCHLPGGFSPVAQSGAKVDYRAELDAATFAVFSRLREARKALADREGMPPYALFTNEQLAEVARRLPRTLTALREVPGIGEVRAERYGAAVLAVIAQHAQQPDTTGGRGGAGPAPGSLPEGGSGQGGQG
jgi:superfamily II DNA helicase RecQ